MLDELGGNLVRFFWGSFFGVCKYIFKHGELKRYGKYCSPIVDERETRESETECLLSTGVETYLDTRYFFFNSGN